MSGISNVNIELETIRNLMCSDATAQEDVYRAFAKPVYNMTVRVLHDQTLAEDITQDIFIEVFNKAKLLKDPNSFVGWLQKIAINQCYRYLRSPWFRRVETKDVTEFESRESEADPSHSVQIDRIFARLAPKQRLVVWLYCIEGYTHEEIAKTLGRTTSYSKSILSRANIVFNNSSKQGTTRNTTPTFQSAWRATK